MLGPLPVAEVVRDGLTGAEAQVSCRRPIGCFPLRLDDTGRGFLINCIGC